MNAPIHKIETYIDQEGQHRWRILVTPGTPAGTEPDNVANSGQGYANEKDMLNSLFGIFFATYDESFLELYAKWKPEDGRPEVPSDQVADAMKAQSIEEQFGTSN